MKKLIVHLGLLLALNTSYLSFSMQESIKKQTCSRIVEEEFNHRIEQIFEQDFSAESQEAVKELIMLGADANVRIGKYKTHILHYIASNNVYEGLIPLLIEKGADVNFRNASQSTPLMIVARNGHKNIVKILLECGADIDAQACFGDTALISAVRRGYISIVKLLLKNKADPNLTNVYKQTALFFATARGLVRAVRLLLEYQADPKIESVFGDTALSVALKPDSRKDIIALLLV